MSIGRGPEQSAPSPDEWEPVALTHHPALPARPDARPAAARPRLRTMDDRERGFTAHGGRLARGTAGPRGGSLPGLIARLRRQACAQEEPVEGHPLVAQRIPFVDPHEGRRQAAHGLLRCELRCEARPGERARAVHASMPQPIRPRWPWTRMRLPETRRGPDTQSLSPAAKGAAPGAEGGNALPTSSSHP